MRKLDEQDVRKIGLHNRSYNVTLPLLAIKELGWREGQKVTVEKVGKTLVIKDWEK